MEQLDDDKDAVVLLKKAIDQEDWQLCKELIRFLHSIDEDGTALCEALVETSLIPTGNGASHEFSPPTTA